VRAPRGESPEVFACACASVRLVARTVTQLYDAALAAAGVQAPQFALMMTLASAGPLNQAALGRRFALEKTTISRNLRVLERNGWIRRVPGGDRRQRRYAVTAEGRQRLAAARSGWRRAQSQLRAAMSNDEWSAMFRLFGVVIGAAHRARAAVRRATATRGAAVARTLQVGGRRRITSSSGLLT
jgi:DNA-binding MarR family transcriptional regulator